MFLGAGLKNCGECLLPSRVQVQILPIPLLRWATHMPDPPKKQPELIATLRVGSVISGECSVCHKTIILTGIHVETQTELKHVLKEAFAEHLGEEHRPDSQSK